ncbi:DUF7144 family membrane protein [Streptomyces candidus]|uniref:DUF7144 domain-containing protein n=1 Tax=Streptomyces candidus TaxID=67283 RepID=A0A7X0LPK5_9ACTN|nr:hypothetical protein [Streptomyces candidus]
MAHSTTSAGNPAGPGSPRADSPWAAGGAMFAGVLLLVDGILDIIKGIVGIAEDDVYSRLGNYVFKFDVTAWGWIHLVLGIVLALVGAGILKNALWARTTGVMLASLSIVINFLWLPYVPVWALVSIGIGVFVIWALCTARTDTTAA